MNYGVFFIFRAIGTPKAQKQLIEYKKDNYPNISNHDFMAKLYTEFGRYSIVVLTRLKVLMIL